MSKLHYFVDESIINAVEISIEKFLETLERERQIAANWLV